MAICSWQTFQRAISTASNKAFQAQSKPPVLRVVMINTNFFKCYVDENYNVKQYFKTTDKNNSYLPQNEEEIISFLKNINFCIETRGKEMMKELSQKETIN